MLHSFRSLTLIVASLACAVGCDTTFTYQYHAFVYEADGRTPAKDVHVSISPEPDDRHFTAGEFRRAVSNAQGEYRGSYSSTLLCSPWPLEGPAPLWTTEVHVRLDVGGSLQYRTVRLSSQQQSKVGRGTRTLSLPVLTLDPPLQPAHAP